VSGRNVLKWQGWTLEKASSSVFPDDFTCGNDDLNDYFHHDCIKYRDALMTQTYVFYHQDDPQRKIVAAVDFCNDALPKEMMTTGPKKKIPHSKRGYDTFPAVKITRLGVHEAVQHQGIGRLLLDAIKRLFLEDNRTGCRFITVDAYREAAAFYEKNDFLRTKHREEEEPDAKTVSLFFDLSLIKS